MASLPLATASTFLLPNFLSISRSIVRMPWKSSTIKNDFPVNREAVSGFMYIIMCLVSSLGQMHDEATAAQFAAVFQGYAAGLAAVIVQLRHHGREVQPEP